MRNRAKTAFLLLLSGLLWWGCFHLWGKQVSPAERLNLVNYLRIQGDSDLISPKFFWAYKAPKLTTGQWLTPSTTQGEYQIVPVDVSDRKQFRDWLKEKVYGGKEFWQVLLWPEIFWGVGTLLLFFLSADRSSKAQEGDLIRGPKLVSHFRWNLRTLFQKKGLYIPTE